MNNRRVQWSSLPSDLLSSIAQRLTTSTDLRHFRAVCTSWRSSTPLPPPKSSLKFPTPICFITPKPNCHYSLAESTIYCIQSLNKNTNTKSWFIKLQQNPTQPHKMLLLDPFSKYQIRKLPKGMPKTINLLDYKVTEISKMFSLRFSSPDYYYDPFVKVVNSTVVDANFILFVLPFISADLFAWRMGDETWTDINHYTADKSRYNDVVFYKGKFYAVKYNGRVLVIDSECKITEIASAVGHVGILNDKFLVVSFGELFLLERCFDKRRESDNWVYWKVYKLYEEKHDWVLVNSLGDRAFFVGRDSSFSVSAPDFPGCKGNTIYFEDDLKGDHPGYKGGIYDLEDGSVGPLSAFLGYSKIFWPPPSWLK